MALSSNLKFTKTDEWLLVEGNIATVGISDFAQNQLSDIVYVEFLVETDDEIKAHTSIATLESVKAAADVNSPVSGTVLEVNDSLADTPDKINSQPYDSWMIKIELSDPSEVTQLMDSAAYVKYCQEREH